MKTIGLLGGMSWESTLGYYRLLNEGIKAALGGHHSAKILLNSVDFAPLEKLQHQADWDAIATHLTEESLKIQRAGADFLLIGTNTMHKVAPQIARSVDIPLLHVADATAEVLIRDGIKSVGLLGTAFTMEQDFYKGRLQSDFNLEVVIPNKNDREIVHRVIYNELCLGEVSSGSRDEYLRIIETLSDQGAEAVILGCTEIGLLVKPQDTKVKLFDTTKIHTAKAVDYALSHS